MPVAPLADWIAEYAIEGKIWFVKRLSANDTGLTGGHQSGVLIARDYLFTVFPDLNDSTIAAPTQDFTMYVDSHTESYTDAKAKWYWSKTEGRFTRIGGVGSAFLDQENTGTIAAFVFDMPQKNIRPECHAWVCEGNGTESDEIEDLLGPVEPRQFIVWQPGIGPAQTNRFGARQIPNLNSCYLPPEDLPQQWKTKFPSGMELIDMVAKLRSESNLDADERLWKRRECEFDLFKSIEEMHFMPRIRQGFESLDTFIATAQSLLQSRRTRGGNSLEYHVRQILREESFGEGQDFSYNEISEGRKKPDFIFPSVDAYRDPAFPKEKLRMLACKTTCKDRWRQVLNEADRIKEKHLITLQEGLSVHQFEEMRSAGVKLVIPKKNLKKFPESIRPELTTFQDFIAELRLMHAD